MDKESEEEVTRELFTEEKRNTIVRSFIEAFVRGSVTIDFITAEELKSHPEILELSRKQFEIPSEQYLSEVEVEVRYKEQFTSRVAIATGATKARKEEVKVALEELFRQIITWRNAQRIKGEFLEVPRLEGRLESLEIRVTELENLLEELQNLSRIRGPPRP